MFKFSEKNVIILNALENGLLGLAPDYSDTPGQRVGTLVTEKPRPSPSYLLIAV